ncbi:MULTISPECIES: bifunctional [glutamate--ammonia ligase]-adenylyl-L-tyrosine phosphorylase/[glutamate--ammonia-ligase] adenylyltransferase [Gammaproteobacteria]|uniref:bifunctional [glutamate--ammonia ligase]-adenylyl-L-tyrosine phosphorylase/[glutamate--ammonia-ligase] adenylyltransferase n=1 Tax=Gammaproteobacteria TaxID=1236 RepID=UPI000DCFBBA8|nr:MULTISPECIES: bifunctional [glutamate--ammonia ligase]-adenylyl-L-tyrosine phosphorylase/[glutamate--ammonia-ligase] adenylyltransferase [Gammaproteobacteria]RTE87696.1 bifunctional [glutamate--ammonia ligase]-adenylyl-L-tyrosine phosphorylase/[glutamate--ammonia-ligase] adenylyltransferase [Aliidiomarina sp. B3213]TCZ92521.1 bifunctional [glutamate--ammonia ligase]-adenylyl-L-tyrosine phosphorylase/[glutamate--ammonia-ligase] adenylyltransferase [Lysobacter sp. N42]
MLQFPKQIFPAPQLETETLSKELQEVLASHLERLAEKWSSVWVEQLSESEKWSVALSDFVAETLFRYGDDALSHFRADQGYRANDIESGIGDCDTEQNVLAQIRKFRHLEMARIAHLDLSGQLSTEDVLEQNTAIADHLITATAHWAEQHLAPRYGYAYFEEKKLPLWIIAMGKLGGRELNFSSDVDLIFCFEHEGATAGGKRSVDHEIYYAKLAQLVVKLLNQTTVDGQAFRVDLRLRPFGQSGPIVSSLSALEAYYQEQGRNWERYAMVKSRVINATADIEEMFASVLRPFVYRRYLDYSAIDALRKMKSMINQEARRQNQTINVKLGTGGIREIEFLAQAFQLMRGGREPELQTRSLLQAINASVALDIFSEQEAQQIVLRYSQLRKIEHVLQQINDQQTQRLPDNELDQARICAALNMSGWSEFLAEYEQITAEVHEYFSDLFGGDEEQQGKQDSAFSLLWHDLTEDETAVGVLADAGAEQPEACWERIRNFRQHLKRRSSGPRGREILADLIPQLIEELVEVEETYEVLQRVFDVLDRVASRTTYLELLYSNSGARNQLVSLCAKSPWVAHLIAKFPILLDELIDPLKLFDLPEPSSYGQRVAEYLNRFAIDDAEMLMEGVRQVKQIFQLHVAAADLSDGVELMRVSDHLTYLAQALVEQVVLAAWRQLAEKHGVPPGKSETNTGFGVVAYGKLGGFELGYGSDLDLVFLCEDNISGETDGPRPIDSQQFYLRLAQRTLHLFTTRTAHGVLYDVDMRLRPSGQAGLMVVRASTYEDYLTTEAWTWEIQALVRARFIFGSEPLKQQFGDIRERVLAQPRELASLRHEIKEMRQRLKDHSLIKHESKVDIKQADGGMTDIEFITQFVVLAYSNQHSDLLSFTDNIRILEKAEQAGIVSEEERELLVEAYKALRTENHKLALAEIKGLSGGDFSRQMQQVRKVWDRLIEAASL